MPTPMLKVRAMSATRRTSRAYPRHVNELRLGQCSGMSSEELPKSRRVEAFTSRRKIGPWRTSSALEDAFVATCGISFGASPYMSGAAIAQTAERNRGALSRCTRSGPSKRLRSAGSSQALTGAYSAQAMLIWLSSRQRRSVFEYAVEAEGEVALEAACSVASGLTFLYAPFDVG